MAAANSTEGHISCSLCLDVFKDPRTLTCGHTFCRTCLQNHINCREHEGILQCPHCRNTIHIPDRQKPLSSYAEQFLRVPALVDAIDGFKKLQIGEKKRLKKKLKRCKQPTITEMTYIGPERASAVLQHYKTLDTRTPPYDSFHPNIKSVLVIESAKIVFSDCANCSIKMFSLQTCHLEKLLPTSGRPFGLAESRDLHLICTLPWEREIVYLNLRLNFKLTQRLKTEKEYFYISVLSNNQTVVSGGWHGCIDILDQSGQIIKSLSVDVPVWHIVINDERLVFASEGNALKCMALSGHVTQLSRDSRNLRNIRGVACDTEGFVYVCCKEGNSIVQLSSKSEIIRDVINDSRFICKPETVCCFQDKLCVAQENGVAKIFTWCNM